MVHTLPTMQRSLRMGRKGMTHAGQREEGTPPKVSRFFSEALCAALSACHCPTPCRLPRSRGLDP